MKFTIDVGAGEIIDRIAILELKMEKLKDSEKSLAVQKELSRLYAAFGGECREAKWIDEEVVDAIFEIKAVNRDIWDAVEAQHNTPLATESWYDASELVLARNDRRAEIKRKLDRAFGTEDSEQKSFM